MLRQPAEVRWREWGNQTDPALTRSEHWQAIASHLDRLDPAINFDRLSQRFRGTTADLILALLKDHNDPEHTDAGIGNGLQQQATPTLSAEEKHRRVYGRDSRPADAPSR